MEDVTLPTSSPSRAGEVFSSFCCVKGMRLLVFFFSFSVLSLFLVNRVVSRSIPELSFSQEKAKRRLRGGRIKAKDVLKAAWSERR